MTEELPDKTAISEQEGLIYWARAKPYYDIQANQGRHLTPEEVEKVDRIIKEMQSKYTSKSLTDSGVYGDIKGVIGWTRDTLQHRIYEEELEEKLILLERELEKKGELTEEKKELLYDRCNFICYTLDPAHFRGPTYRGDEHSDLTFKAFLERKGYIKLAEKILW